MVKLRIQINLIYILIFSSLLIGGCSTGSISCSDDWRVTGYFTPVETKEPAKTSVIKLNSGEQYRFDPGFIKKVRVEGWGKTRFGWYLGHYGGKWHKADYPKNALGGALTVGQVAIGSKKVPKMSRVSIPALKSLINKDLFIATDVGSQIQGKKVDVYTGEGETARQLSYKVTGYHRVCLSRNTKSVPVVEI